MIHELINKYKVNIMDYKFLKNTYLYVSCQKNRKNKIESRVKLCTHNYFHCIFSYNN